MEIEAKFIVSDRILFDSLMNIDKIGDLDVRDAVLKEFVDTYLDTVDMAIYGAGFSFRCREKKDKVVYTLKSLKGSGSLIHMREETEFSMSEKLPVREWDNCILRKRVLGFIGSGELYPLFTVEHQRTDLQIYSGEKHIAELSFDDVSIVCDDNKKSYLELEVELMGEGTEADIHRIAEFFRDEIGLAVGSSSKFDNGFKLYMENIRTDASTLYAGTIPRSGEGISLPLMEMLDEYNIEQDHARKVTENALQLFDALEPVHHLDRRLRQTMRFAALVHDIGVMTDMKTHHKVGRDILLELCPEELPQPLCMFLPWTTFLHKKRMDRNKLFKLSQKKKFSRFSLQMQDDIIKMASILRIADGLDISRKNSTIVDVDLEKEDIVIKVRGSAAAIDADRADTKADLWRLIFEKDIYFREDY
ncbi:CYTH domain-containing protein [Methanolobus profundi]|uniref:Exopolyphosphatase / guanosine-5'-triphosphate,3'-diphosphate pyrophosphatase n=1 Tax=Methanolobus profundi TaxID=487685 RepID=A0A1I4SA39_9EURY|nr:CYTH domain-containing protein [Methanolobus profundi]SFM61144.1 exopolyphosphatase / guanosine-5'-triphosphate,3'-diphosphate pyrophosphatase [Methanolobus profundi]